MQKQKAKRGLKKMIVIMLLAIVVIFNAPAIVSGVKEMVEDKTVYAQGVEMDFTPAEIAQLDAEAAAAAGQQASTEDSQSQIAAALNSESIKNTAAFIVAIQKFLNRLLWPVLIMIGGLMDNSLLFGAGMEERLRDIWIPIRNIVNILFVVALVGIALYNVLGIGEEGDQYSIKAILPKLIIGIIAVNFSFLGIKVFLDAVNVVTVSIFALPDQVSEGVGRVNVLDDNKVIKRFCLAMEGKTVSQVRNDIQEQDLIDSSKLELAKKTAQTYGVPENDYKGAKTAADVRTAAQKYFTDQNNPQGFANYESSYDAYINGKICEGTKLSDSGKAYLAEYGSRNAALAMALNMGKVVFYEDVDLEITDMEKLIVSTLFSVLLYIIYAASFVALFIVLLARLVFLWVAIAMSPVLVLVFGAPELAGKVPALNGVSEKFVKNAIAPTLIALAMTVGWIMLKAMQSVNNRNLFVEQQNAVTPFSGLDTAIPVVGLNTLQDIVVALGTVAIVWLGVFAAAEGTIAETLVNHLKEGITAAGKFIGTVPFKHFRMIPVKLPSGETVDATPLQVKKVFDSMTNEPVDANDLVNKLGGKKTASLNHLNSEIDTRRDFIKWANSTGIRENLKENKYRSEVNRWLTAHGNLVAGDTALNQALQNYRNPNNDPKEMAPKVLQEIERIVTDENIKGEYTPKEKKPVETSFANDNKVNVLTTTGVEEKEIGAAGATEMNNLIAKGKEKRSAKTDDELIQTLIRLGEAVKKNTNGGSMQFKSFKGLLKNDPTLLNRILEILEKNDKYKNYLGKDAANKVQQILSGTRANWDPNAPATTNNP